MFRPVRAGCASGGDCTCHPMSARRLCAVPEDLVLCLFRGYSTAGTCQPPPSLFCNPRVAPGSSGNACPAESACITVGTQLNSRWVGVRLKA